jgi:2-hydroxy-3-oxopropionate reductase
MVVGATIAIVAEALVLAKKPASIRPRCDKPARRLCPIENFSKAWAENAGAKFQPGFRIRLHEKDMKIALATGSEYGVPLMVSGVVAQMMTAMKGMALADLDHSALVKLIEELAKTELS